MATFVCKVCGAEARYEEGQVHIEPDEMEKCQDLAASRVDPLTCRNLRDASRDIGLHMYD